MFRNLEFCSCRIKAVILWVEAVGGGSRMLLFWSKSRINRLPFFNTSSSCCLKDFTAWRRRTNSENKEEREEGQRGTCSGLALKPLLPFCSDFTSLGFFLSPTLYSLSYSPTLCSLSPHFLPTLFISLPSNPSLFILTLSPSIWWNSAADNACNWSDSHFSSVFGPDKEYCQHFADMASAGRIKWTLFCLQQIKSLSIHLFSPEGTPWRGGGRE